MNDRPRVFRIDAQNAPGDEASMRTRDGFDVAATADPFAYQIAPAEAVVKGRLRKFGWFPLFISSASAFVMLAIGIGVHSFVVDLFRSNPTLGYVAFGLSGLALLGLVGFLCREIASIWRAARIERLARDVAAVRVSDDLTDGRRLARDLVALYSSRPDTARGRSRIEEIDADLIDARGRLAFVERELLATLDVRARGAVAAAASRVALMTTISPRALIDVLFVLGVSVALLRRVSEIYGGRPGLLGFLRVGRHVLTHLTITGGVAIGEGLAQQILGAGVAARLSAKLGEGVVNGLLTARVGLSAITVCRPMGFDALPVPTLSEVAAVLLRSSVKAAAD